MSFYIDSKNKGDCFNCTACATACPQKCITMELDEKDGYIYPKVDKEKCINCGKCKNVCINLHQTNLQNKIKHAYVLFNKDNKTRKTSASGGISNLLMEYVIGKSGVVYGAKYNEKLIVVHDRVTSIEECEKFRTSKYVRSDINGIYNKVLEDLKTGKMVLFTGTPCQIAGLKAVTSKSLQDNLILCEIMCDSVASPLLFDKFKDAIEKKYKKKIKNINFRSKVNGAHKKTMCIEFDDGVKEILKITSNNIYSEYMQMFGLGISAPISCSNCEFEHINERTSDFTIGDYWGRKEILEDDNNGISLMLVNSQKGEKIFEEYITNKTIYKEVNVMEALDNNHIKAKKNILNKEHFLKDLPNSTFEELANKYVRKYRWRTKLGKLIPKNLKEKIKEIINKK